MNMMIETAGIMVRMINLEGIVGSVITLERKRRNLKKIKRKNVIIEMTMILIILRKNTRNLARTVVKEMMRAVLMARRKRRKETEVRTGMTRERKRRRGRRTRTETETFLE